jgi:Fanconi-associated nuclease 1
MKALVVTACAIAAQHTLRHLHAPHAPQAVEAALADSWVRGGDLLGLQRRLLRLGKPPRRWKRPSWATAVGWEPPEVVITARPLANPTGGKSRFVC